MQKNPRKPISYTPARVHAVGTLSKHGNPPNAASLNASTRNSDAQHVREQNAAIFVGARKAGTLAHQRNLTAEQLRAAFKAA